MCVACVLPPTLIISTHILRRRGEDFVVREKTVQESPGTTKYVRFVAWREVNRSAQEVSTICNAMVILFCILSATTIDRFRSQPASWGGGARRHMATVGRREQIKIHKARAKRPLPSRRDSPLDCPFTPSRRKSVQRNQCRLSVCGAVPSLSLPTDTNNSASGNKTTSNKSGMGCGLST